MKYGPKNLNEMTIDELKAADADLAFKADHFNKSVENSERAKKLNPRPKLSETFTKLQQEIKDEIKVRNA